jgi:hypothetical protein
MQTGAPLEQSVVAVAVHGLLDVQAAPGEQALQVFGGAPLGPLHTPVIVPDVHAAPAARNVWSLQTGVPLEQSMAAPVAQGLLEVHVAPWVHAVQMPVAPLQTPAAPPEVVQAAPAAWNVWSLQTGAPVEQSMVAALAHGFADAQVAP